MRAPLAAIEGFISECKAGKMNSFNDFYSSLASLEKKCAGLEAPLSPFPNSSLNKEQLRNSFSALKASCVDGVALSRRYAASLKFLAAGMTK